MTRSKEKAMANVCGRTVDAVSSEVDRRFESGDVSGAVQCIRHALTISPTLTSMYVGLGDVLATTVHLEEAAAAYQSAIRQEPRSMDIYYRMGMLYGGQDQTAQARSSFQAAVALSPTSVESLFALGICMSLENDWFEAERHIRRVLRLRPGHESARFDLAVALQQLKRPQEALNSYDGCLTTYTSSAVERHEAWANRAGVLVDLGRVVEAISSYGKALVIAPRFPAVYANLAVVYNGHQRQAEALEALRVAQKLAPTFSPIHLNLGLTLKQTGQYVEATHAFIDALQLAPQSHESLCHVAFSHKRLSTWKGWEVLLRDARHVWRAGNGGQAWDPLYGLALPLRAPLIRQLATDRASRVVRDTTNQIQPPARPTWLRSNAAADLERLRVGYLSADFGATAVGSTIRGFFGRHAQQPDEDFDVFSFSLRADDTSDFYRSVIHAVDKSLAVFEVVSETTAHTHLPGGRVVRERVQRLSEDRDEHVTNRRFVDLSAADLHAASSSLKAAQFHVLVDLNGYTDGERTELLALRPAPVVMHALGFPATLGANFVPYILLDRHVALPAPRVHQALTERLVMLPHCYLVNGHHDAFGAESLLLGAAPPPTPHKTLLINFNQLYKLEPRTVLLWCGLLQHSAGRAVLWLRRQPEQSAPAILKEFHACGARGAQVVFADYNYDEQLHMQRIANAHLSLDTPEYNGHTTGNDMLWAAVPLLSVPAEHLTARMGRSLLAACGVSPGEVRSLRSYQTLALALATPSALLPSAKATSIQGVRRTIGAGAESAAGTPRTSERSRRRVRREFSGVAALW
jgi:protein O-GlcNAc transferase